MANSLLQVDVPWTQNPPYGTKAEETWLKKYAPSAVLPFNESAGPTAFDLSGHEKNAALISGASWGSASILGGALKLVAASSQYANLPCKVVTNHITILGWFYPNSVSNTMGAVLTRDYSLSGLMMGYGTSKAWTTSYNGIGYNDNTSLIPVAKQWQFAASVINGLTGFTTYFGLLGGALSSYVHSGGYAAGTINTWSLGRDPAPATYFDGFIRGVQIFDGLAMSLAQVEDQFYNPFGWAKKRRYVLPIASAAPASQYFRRTRSEFGTRIGSRQVAA